MTIKTDIARYKKSLIEKVKKKGLYENFGQEEVRKLKNKYPHLNWGDKIERLNDDLILDFDKWCRTFDDRKLKNER